MKNNKKFLITLCSFVTIILAALFIGDVNDNIAALGRILSMEGILLSDAIGINRGFDGVVNGVLLNTFITTGWALIIVKLTKVPFEGPVFAGVFTVAGFTFVGKNLWNLLPIFFGVFLYAKYRKWEVREVITPMLFSTAIAPLVSYMLFGAGMQDLDLVIRVALAIGVGILVGFLAPMVATQALKFHAGFNLYNLGFTMGLISIVAHSILRTVGIHVQFVGVPLAGFPNHTIFFMVVLAAISVGGIIMAFIMDKDVLKKYKKITVQTGQAPSNFSESAGQATVLLNMGVLGLMALALIIPMLFWLDIPFLAVFGASTLTIMGFSAFGKHPLNIMPILIGTGIAFVAIYLIDSPYLLINPTGDPDGAYLSTLNIHVYVSAVFFATCLAPISREYGWKAGVITGLVHMTMVMTARSFQGGFNLYNNGWVAGFIGGIMVPIYDVFFRKYKEARQAKMEKTT